MIRPRKRSKIWPGRCLRALRETDRQQLLVGEPRPPRGQHHSVPGARRIADPELAQRLLAQPAAEQVLAGVRGLARLPQVPGVVDRAPLYERLQPVSPLALGGRLGILRLDLELDPEPLGERLERAGEVDAFGLHHELECVARRLAAEAVIQPLVRADVKRARALVVKRADPEVAVDAGAAQLGPGRDQRDHVDRLAHALAGVVGVARHGANATGMLNRSNARMQNRSVIPAR